MNPATPSGTRTREISRPLGWRHDSTTAPTGSGRVAISRSPWAIPSIRDSVSVRRSRNALLTRPRARSTSARLASSSTWLFSTSPPAICWSASFFVFVGQSAIARAAARAARARDSMRVFGSISPSSGTPRPAGPQPRDGLQRAQPTSGAPRPAGPQPRDGLQRAQPTSGAPRPAGPQPRDGLQRAQPTSGAPRPAGPQPRDGLQRAQPTSGAPRPAGPQPRDGLQRAMPKGSPGYRGG